MTAQPLEVNPESELFVAGSNDEQTTCDRCGKTHLGVTVILRDGD